jgi:hypothetical protein
LSIVRGLALVHLSATALLLAAFVILVLCQRLARPLARPPVPTPYPSDVEALAVPAAVLPAVPPPAEGARPGASVLDWTIDLREPRSAGAQLQTS